jgi:dynein heavy chain
MSDLRISKQQLNLYLNEFVKIPYDALNYMVAKANYGGRVTDSQDKRTISILLAEYFNEKVVENDEHPLTPSGSYRIPPDLDRMGYIEYTEALPLDDSTEIFGMHPNAEITSNINSTVQLMATALSLLPRVVNTGGKTRDDEITDLSKDILNRLPADFDLDAVKKRYPITYNESMNTVLQ